MLSPAKVKAIEEEVTHIDCGVDHAAAISSEGKLYTWGSNTFNQLGNTKSKSLKIPTIVDSFEGARIVSVSCSKGLKH